MPLFVSYSHRDREFATHLAAQLIKHRSRVWIDEWELQVGDSIVDRIQNAIQGASALLVLLSQASVESEWCKKELSAGLIRELEEKRVLVLPVLIESCEIPLFLRDKLYADFRTDFDAGLRAVLDAVAGITSDTLGRIDEPEWHIDWSIDWGMAQALVWIRVTLVDQAKHEPYSCLTQVRIIANEEATARYRAFEKQDLDWFQRNVVLEMLAEGSYDKELRVLLEDEKPKTQELTLRDTGSAAEHHVVIEARRLGQDTGRDILLDLGAQLRGIRDALRENSRKLTAEELGWIRDTRNRGFAQG